MTVNHNELLSALVDGELQGEELDYTLNLIHSDEQVRQQWQRYQRTSDILHGHSLSQQNCDLTKQISQRLTEEPSYSSKPQTAQIIRFPKQFWKQAASLAVAASVGAIAVVGVMNQPENQINATAQLAANESVQPVTVAQTGKRWTVDEQEVEQRLNTYLVDHNEYTGAPGVFSYARVISYDEGQ